ncbi:YceI family protein [Hellea sp.]|nr:YceI family protein [Hellea sp.]
MKIITLPLIAALLAVSACSQASEPAAKRAAQATEPAPVATLAKVERVGNWTVIKANSHIKFTASQQGKSFTGEFKDYDVVINFKKDALKEAGVTATINVASIAAGDKDRNSALPGKEWFNVTAFPKAVFKSDDFVKVSGNQYEARGTLTMKGKSQPLTLPFTLDINGAKAQMAGKVKLDRTLWKVGTGSWSTDEWVSTDVTVDIKISAESAN